MALDAEHRKQLPDPEIQGCQGHPEHRFDLSLKTGTLWRIYREAPWCGYSQVNWHT
jgi:hypothetical protein